MILCSLIESLISTFEGADYVFSKSAYVMRISTGGPRQDDTKDCSKACLCVIDLGAKMRRYDFTMSKRQI
jgi:hypothetical protein